MCLTLFEFLRFLAHIVCIVKLCLIERRLILHEKQKVCLMRLNRKHVGLLIVKLVHSVMRCSFYSIAFTGKMI